MTRQGIDFLDKWVQKNVTAADTGQARAAILAAQCILQATEQGIQFSHMEIEEQELEQMIEEVADYLASLQRPKG